MKFAFTDAGQKTLATVLRFHQKKLEEMIAERKFVLGDETVEVTASDVVDAAKRIQYNRPRSLTNLGLMARTYVLIGALIVAAGVALPYLRSVIQENREQAMLMTIGLAMVVAGSLLNIYVKSRNPWSREDQRETNMIVSDLEQARATSMGASSHFMKSASDANSDPSETSTNGDPPKST